MKPGDKIKIMRGPHAGKSAVVTDIIEDGRKSFVMAKLDDGAVVKVLDLDYRLEWSTARKVGTLIALGLGAVFTLLVASGKMKL